MRLASITCIAIMALAAPLAGCRSEQGPDPEESGGGVASSAAAETKLPTIAAEAPIDRAQLLDAAAAAADWVVAGEPLPEGNLKLASRSFRLRLPFGCGDGLGEWGSWHVDPKSRVLRISVQPQVWGDDPTFKALAAGMAYDTAEGFWIERPWTRSEKCPQSTVPVPASASSSPPNEPLPDAPPQSGRPSQTLALVQYFSPDEPRTLRRGSRPYSFTTKVPQDQIARARSFRLTIAGRIRGFADGQPIHCLTRGASSPPLCAAAVEFVRVAIEDAQTGDVVAEWNG